MTAGSRRDPFLLEDDDIRACSTHEVRHGRADDTPTDHDDVGCAIQGNFPSRDLDGEASRRHGLAT